MKFIKWLGTQTYLTNGQVIGWFTLGILVGTVLGICIRIGIAK